MKDKPNVGAEAESKPSLSSSVQVLQLQDGLYCFLVRGGAGKPAGTTDLAVPALHISEAPTTTRRGQLSFLASPAMTGSWLTKQGDAIVAQISGGPCPVVLTSITSDPTAPLDIEVRRLDQVAQPIPSAAAKTEIVGGSGGAAKPAPAKADAGAIRVQVLAHIQNRGDVPFVGSAWAGYVGQSLWIEAFALSAPDALGPDAIEYKGRTAGGFETPWLSGSSWCGTRGMGVPLVEFAIRLNPESAAKYDCEYSGAFFSGNMIGPLKEGQPCRSSVPNDPLEAIQVRIVERAAQPATRGRGKS